MRATSLEVSVLNNCDKIRLILVQNKSPFGPGAPELELQVDRDGSRFRWKSAEQVGARVSHFNGTLAALKRKNLFSTSHPSVVLFPEYAVPKEAHGQVQDFSDENNCIVIPGTYYESEEDAELCNNNVCKIYTPSQPSITIVKQHGFDREQQALAGAVGAFNIAHLRGKNTTLGPFSLSVYICKDYLVPYHLDEANPILLTDWHVPGINLVTMCSPQTALFESLASFDVRGLRGRRRLTALCNCAGTSVDGDVLTGTALVGPRHNLQEFEGDVIRRLRSHEEGVIVADLFLNSNDLAIVETKPGTQRFAPIRSATAYEMSVPAPRPKDGTLVELHEISGSAITTRGVWHPAFLEKLNLKIVLQLFRARDLIQVREAIRNKGIRFVSVFVLEGTWDLLIRYYESENAHLNVSDSPYNTMSKEQFDKLFIGALTRIEVRPRDIIKFRTLPIRVNASDDVEWQKRKQLIDENLPDTVGHARHRALLAQISKLSRDWNDATINDKVRRDLEPVFFAGREIVPPTAAYQPGRNNVRETFILVSMSIGDTNDAKRAEFETEIINRRLMQLPEVRSIYRINVRQNDVVFDFWVDIVAESWRVRDIILQMDHWGHQIGVTCGSRALGVLDYLLLDSVQGVHATDRAASIHQFIEASRKLDPAIIRSALLDEVEDANDFLGTCSDHWYLERYNFRGTDAAFLQHKFNEFYVYLFWGNVASDPANRADYLHKAGGAWNNLYQQLERRFETILREYLKVDADGELWTHSLTHLQECGVNEQELKTIKENGGEQVFHLARRDKKFTALSGIDLTATTRFYKEKVVKLRNKVTHAGGSVDFLAVYPRKKMEGGWSASDIAAITCGLVDLLNVAADCLSALEVPE